MQPDDDVIWDERLRQTLHSYDPALLRAVCGRLVKPRNQQPAQELIDRAVESLNNPVVVDRRLKELEPIGRRLLALMGHSRQARWKLGPLIEILVALGNSDGPGPILALFEAGLLYPSLPEKSNKLTSFEQWIGIGTSGLSVYAHPGVLVRAIGEDLDLPDLGSEITPTGGIRETDGLEMLLRLAALWQQIAAAPLRQTLQHDFFKRDLDRLRSDTLLGAAPTESMTDIPDPGLLTVALAENLDVLVDQDNELRAATLPGEWDKGLPQASAEIWRRLWTLENWNPRDGWCGPLSGANPFPSAYLLCFALLARLRPEQWAHPEEIEEWIVKHHPFWSQDGLRPSQRKSWLPTFLLGLAFQLRWIQAVKDSDESWYVRLSPLGRWLYGIGDEPQPAPSFPQTLVVQPNLEIIVYRQGLNPALITRLSRFAEWKSFGSACALQLSAESVYRGLESGLGFEGIVQTLEQHGTRTLPTAVVESLRTWADKRERISVFPSATLFEFASVEDMNEALARGLPGIRLTDRLLAVASENDIDFRHFRLAGTRDYGLPPEQCVGVGEDGVTLAIDLARSDLLMETELERFAEPLDQAGVNGKRRYRLTPESLGRGRECGMGLRELEDWFIQRTGQPISPAARLLMSGEHLEVIEARRRIILHIFNPDLADGLMQWPATRDLIEDRLGPTSLAVAEENLAAMAEKLKAIGASLQILDKPDAPPPE
jgi:hypothetical protein